MRNIIIISLFACFLMMVSCKDTQTTPVDKEQNLSNDYELIGKKGEITYPDMKASLDFKSETELHWTSEAKDGTISHGDEKLSYKRLSDELHFLNWIEEGGFTVSQVINTKQGTVKAFWSFTNDAGKRESTFVDGTFKYVK